MKHNFKYYCKDYENIENYEKAKADDFKGWDLHHRLETHNSDGERRLVDITRDELMALDMYYNRPADELIFLTTAKHNQLHHIGRHHTEDSKKRISAASKGRRHTEEARKKMSDAAKGKKHSEESKKKISEAVRINSIGRHWYNNGKENKFCYECPEGFVPGMLK